MRSTLQIRSPQTPTQGKKAYKGLPLEGFLARWYARNTAAVMHEYEQLALDLAAKIADGSSVLEVAPGPGYLAIALAKLGNYRIVGLDISNTFVEMAADNARKAGVEVAFRRGDAANMPFEPGSFDFIVCRAAFKNFTEPVQALSEMHHVLKPGGQALIVDMRNNASAKEIDDHVKTMGLGPINTVITKLIFKHSLVKRAYSQAHFRQMIAETPF